MDAREGDLFEESYKYRRAISILTQCLAVGIL